MITILYFRGKGKEMFSSILNVFVQEKRQSSLPFKGVFFPEEPYYFFKQA
jgi:hypothetical protein